MSHRITPPGGIVLTQNAVGQNPDLNLREGRRLMSLAGYGLDDARQASAIGEELTRHPVDASSRTGLPFAAVNIVGDGYEQTIAGTDGVMMEVRDRTHGICGRILYAAGSGDAFATGDASLDPDLWDHPFVSGARGRIRFYAGAALIGREGLPLGMLCVFSTEPMSHRAAERTGERLLPVRDNVMDFLEARRLAGERAGRPRIANRHLSSQPARVVLPRDRAEIDDVIDDDAVQTVFQPIVHLETGAVAAFEALSRGPAGTELESPIALLDAARAAGRLGELDWLCRASAMRAAASSSLPRELSWFINVEPAGLEIDCPQHLQPTLDQARAELRVVLEVVERGVEDHATRLLNATEQARRDAWGVALDDVGAEAGSLALLPLLQPDVVKLDMSLLGEAPSSTAADVTAAVRAYAERTGAVILAEGIETTEQAALAEVFGATYGQGYLYGRPGPLPESVPAPARPIPLRQKPSPVQGATPFEALSETISSQRGRAEHLHHIVVHLIEHCQRAEPGAVLLGLFNSPESYLQHRDRIDALAARNALSICLVRDFPEQPVNPHHHVGPLPPESRLTDERLLIVVSPHFTGTLAIRETRQNQIDGTPLVDYIYTHDRNASIAAARAYLDHMKPGTVTYPDVCGASGDNRHTEQSRRTRVVSYLTERFHLAPQRVSSSAKVSDDPFRPDLPAGAVRRVPPKAS